ncbi:helix-turn-helix transcriptional regulator [Morganella morganii]|nr:helix-turn-helix transcriptional regulator [Morganella morganii]OFV03215.1 hypothetical protein HMPREF3119_02190 [Morganella sp. HMSC11D09]ELB1288845.1 helix-turn-helix transcriptional regulator [Morganella morganii]HCL5895651.1 helix-turn-helix transcriptional regulator [Morganella morganii]HCR3195094.1 helix-turn-helix transcriptional regulator [Morganella morganii]
MKTMHDRIKQARLAKKMTQAELAEKVGVTPQSVQQWESVTEPKKNRVVKIAEILGVEANWLLFGSDTRDGIPVKDFKPREVAEWDSSTPLDDDEVEVPYYKSIELAAGNGCNGGSDNNGYKLRFSRSTLRRYGISPKDVASFPVHGESMSPVIPNGTTVFVNCGDKTIVDGGIYFIEQDGLLRIKQLLRQPGKLIIRSYNSIDFPDEEADPTTVKIVGRVFNWSVMAY